jgi:hypothetical protein
MTLVVRERRHIFLSDLTRICAPSRAIMAKKRSQVWLLESCLKTELIAVEGDGLIDVADDGKMMKSLASPVVS